MRGGRKGGRDVAVHTTTTQYLLFASFQGTAVIIHGKEGVGSPDFPGIV